MSEAATSTELEAATPTELVVPEASEAPEVVFDSIALVRELIVHEVISPCPSFELIKKYTDVLRATMAHKGQLSVENVSEPSRPISQGHLITGTDDLVLGATGTGATITVGGGAAPIDWNAPLTKSVLREFLPAAQKAYVETYKSADDLWTRGRKEASADEHRRLAVLSKFIRYLGAVPCSKEAS